MCERSQGAGCKLPGTGLLVVQVQLLKQAWILATSGLLHNIFPAIIKIKEMYMADVANCWDSPS